jgi:hypothetical protein
LREIIRFDRRQCTPRRKDESKIGDIGVTSWQVRVGDEWTLPGVEFFPADARSRTIIIADRGRKDAGEIVRRQVAAGQRVLAIDLLGFGEAGIGIEPIELQMIATVGRRPLGVQVAQLLAAADWFDEDEVKPGLVALGPRSGVIALVAAAVEPEIFAEVELRDSWSSLKEFISRDMELKDAPELGCFGLLHEFDLAQLEMLSSAPIIWRISDDEL